MGDNFRRSKGTTPLIYEGPPSGAKIVKTVLDNYGISYTSPHEGESNGKEYKVLLLGNNFIVAHDFRVEENGT